MRELDIVASRQETVKNGGNLALQDELSIHKADLLSCHDRVPHSTTCLFAIWRSAVVLRLLVIQLICECSIRLEGVGSPQMRSAVGFRVWPKDIIVVAFADWD
jgi:hypothetical protein